MFCLTTRKRNGGLLKVSSNNSLELWWKYFNYR